MLILLQSLHLERLALYHDSNSFPWKIDKRWEDLSPKEWIEVCFCQIIILCYFVVAYVSWGQWNSLRLLSSLLFQLIFVQIFEDGINEPAVDSGMVSSWALNRKYLVSPINGVLQYHRLGNQERNDPEIPFEKASLVLRDVSLTITEVWSLFFKSLSTLNPQST